MWSRRNFQVFSTYDFSFGEQKIAHFTAPVSDRVLWNDV